ncbi:MAG TPA: hypothetical protein VMU01_09875 [Rhizomicrobium sp.]|nr:hypothetical protein [Rhizomicrobium sp.]
MNRLVSVAEANALIDAGKCIHVAGAEGALRGLHRGLWIGGTIPYFLTRSGGVIEREKVFITEFPPEVTKARIGMVDIGHILSIAGDAPRNGFSLIVVPGMSDIHTAYAVTANNMPGIFETPIVGWIAGIHLNDLGRVTPKVFDGATGEIADDRIAVMHATLPADKKAVIGTINPFSPGDGDEIVFAESGFSAKECTVNGSQDDFYDYAVRNQLDLTRPLVTMRNNQRVNASFQKIDHESRTVKFYAPLLKALAYRQAAHLPDYRAALIEATQDLNISPAFSCNCILNFLYGRLEGTQYLPIAGPATFGEVAHILLNQTIVYLEIANQ